MTVKPLHLTIRITLEAESVAALLEFLRNAIEPKADDRTTELSLVRRKMTPMEASQHALFGGQKPPEDRGLLLDTRQVSKMLNVSARHVSSLQVTGRMPKPIRIGRVVRWSQEEIKAWVEAGCPHRDKWIWNRKPK
jgi:predicted DNA-binding transcriptional regulator AlpA